MTRKVKNSNGDAVTENDLITAKEISTEITLSKTIPAIVTGYQYGDEGAFIGEYRFEKNLDNEAVHCPPCTALCAPPGNLPVDEEAYFDGEQWQVRKLSLPWLPDVELPKNGEVPHGN